MTRTFVNEEAGVNGGVGGIVTEHPVNSLSFEDRDLDWVV
jgi:hypothetical protein